MLGPIVLAIAVAHPLPALQGRPVPQPPTAVVQPAPEQPWPPEGVYRPGKEVVPPRIKKEAKPRYTSEARHAKIEGTVVMEAVVRTDGTVRDVRVIRSLDRKYGLDDEAVAAVKTWEFAPGRKDGVAVPVLVEIEMTFKLRDK